MQSTIYVEMAPGVSIEELYQHLKSSYEVMVYPLCYNSQAILVLFSYLCFKNVL